MLISRWSKEGRKHVRCSIPEFHLGLHGPSCQVLLFLCSLMSPLPLTHTTRQPRCVHCHDVCSVITLPCRLEFEVGLLHEPRVFRPAFNSLGAKTRIPGSRHETNPAHQLYALFGLCDLSLADVRRVANAVRVENALISPSKLLAQDATVVSHATQQDTKTLNIVQFQTSQLRCCTSSGNLIATWT